MNEEKYRVMNLAKKKGFPTEGKDILILLGRISVELGEAMDAYFKKKDNELKEELVDVLIQTLQALGTMNVDIDFLFNNKMCLNETRDFSRHKRIVRRKK